MSKNRIAPVHPGVYLKELLDELGISQQRLAKALGVPPMRISHIVNGRRPVTAEMALRLSLYLSAKPAILAELAEPLRPGYDLGCAGGTAEA